jgi:hypothetical protein
MKEKLSIIIIFFMTVAIGLLSYKLVTTESSKETKECEKQEVQNTGNLEVSYYDIKNLYLNFNNNIDLLERFNNKEVTSKDFTDEEKLSITFAYIFNHEELHKVEKFDNSDGSYAQDKEIIITTAQIKDTVKLLFSDEEYDYLPDITMYEPTLFEFKKDGDIYVGRQIISGHIGGGGYRYFINGYDIKDNQLIINVIAGYVSIEEFNEGPEREEGLYKSKNSTKQIIKYEHIDQDTVEYHQDELNKIKYIFDITEDGYKLNKITINQ